MNSSRLPSFYTHAAAIIFSTWLLLTIAGLVHAAQGLVPCGTSSTQPCTVCDIFILVQNVINFIVESLVMPLAVLFLLYGGILMLLPGFGGEKSVSMYQRGKKVLTNTVIGIIIVFLAWLAIDTVIKILGGKIASDFQSSEYMPWNAIQCTGQMFQPPSEPQPGATPPATTSPPVSPLPPPPSVERDVASSIANAILRSPNVILSTSGDCLNERGERVYARTTITEVADRRELLTVCQNGCRCSTAQQCQQAPRCTLTSTVMVSTELLAAIYTVGQSERFIVSSITTGDHSPLSCHYSGQCVDIIPVDRTVQNFERLRNEFQRAGGEARCETANGRLYNSCLAVPSGEIISHLHISFR